MNVALFTIFVVGIATLVATEREIFEIPLAHPNVYCNCYVGQYSFEDN